MLVNMGNEYGPVLVHGIIRSASHVCGKYAIGTEYYILLVCIGIHTHLSAIKE